MSDIYHRNVKLYKVLKLIWKLIVEVQMMCISEEKLAIDHTAIFVQIKFEKFAAVS